MASSFDVRRHRLPAAGLGLALAGALLFAPGRHAPFGFAPDIDRSVRLVPTPLTPLPLLFDKAAECDGGDGSGAGTPPRPATSPQTWVVTDDYPLSALRTGTQGSTGFRLGVGSGGEVAGCSVTKPSGSIALDDAACFALVRRARFVAARDGRGCPIRSRYASTVRWQMPPDDLTRDPAPN